MKFKRTCQVLQEVTRLFECPRILLLPTEALRLLPGGLPIFTKQTRFHMLKTATVTLHSNRQVERINASIAAVV